MPVTPDPSDATPAGSAAAGLRNGLALMATSDELRTDPHATYHRMRREEPRLYVPEMDEFILTRWDDCERVLRDTTFSSNPAHRRPEFARPTTVRDGLDANADFKVLLFLDPPDHTRLRGLVSKAFTPRTVERLRPRVSELCDEILDRAAAEGGMDVVADLGYVLPVTVICELLGIPAEDRDRFGPWSSDLSRLLDGDMAPDILQRGIVAFMETIAYLNEQIDQRRSHPGDDLLSGLLAAEESGDHLSHMELLSIVLLLFIAGHETTMNLIGNGTWALLRHPDQLERLRRDPSLMPSAVEELLRYDGPVHVNGRIATRTCDVGGTTVEAGQQVITLLAAANRDPERFDEPDALDIGREDNRHLTFSHGIHYCLGAALARLEGQVAIGALVQRFGRIEAVETPTYRPHLVLRGLNSLRVEVGA